MTIPPIRCTHCGEPFESGATGQYCSPICRALEYFDPDPTWYRHYPNE